MSGDPRIKLQNIDLDAFTPETKSKLISLSDKTDDIINQHQIIKYETHYSIILILITILILIFFVIKLVLYIKLRYRLPYRFPTHSNSVPTVSPAEEPSKPAPAEVVKRNKHQQCPEVVPSPSIRVNV